MEDLGRVYEHKKRGWCVEFRSVRWPGRELPRRVIVVEARGYGRIDCEHAARRVQMQIQASVKERECPLHEVLSEYIDEVPEDAVLHRWREQWLPQRRTRNAEGRLSDKRLAEFEQYEGRGHLAFWSETSLNKVRAAHLERWVHWLYAREELDAEGNVVGKRLRSGAIRHIVADFGAFLRYMHRIGSLRAVPILPQIDWSPEEKAIPPLGDVRRILERVPAESRGLWLAHTLAGLRPAEGRRLDVRNYNFETGELHIPTKSRHKRGRRLPIRAVVPELDEWLQHHRRGAMGAEPLFPNRRAAKNRGNPEGRWLPHAERNCWRTACEAAGVEYVQPNAAGRHAFATHEANEGTDLYALKDWMGHTSIATTERYFKLGTSPLARRMRPAAALEEARKRKEGT